MLVIFNIILCIYASVFQLGFSLDAVLLRLCINFSCYTLCLSYPSSFERTDTTWWLINLNSRGEVQTHWHQKIRHSCFNVNLICVCNNHFRCSVVFMTLFIFKPVFLKKHLKICSVTCIYRSACWIEYLSLYQQIFVPQWFNSDKKMF